MNFDEYNRCSIQTLNPSLCFFVLGHHNCPSGFDESEEECGTARKLLELPGGVFAALGCIAAAITACLIFCIFGLLRKRKKTVLQKSIINGGGTLKKDFKKESLYIDPSSWHGLQPVEYIHVDRETTVWYVVEKINKTKSHKTREDCRGGLAEGRRIVLLILGYLKCCSLGD